MGSCMELLTMNPKIKETAEQQWALLQNAIFLQLFHVVQKIASSVLSGVKIKIQFGK